MKCVSIFTSLLALSLVGCASGPKTLSSSYKASSTNTEYIRNTQGQTEYRITDGNVFTPTGTRVARIDSKGNIFNTQGTRLGRVTK